MAEQKIQMEMNDHPYQNGLIYAAVSIGGGYAVRKYIIDNNTYFESNYAFYNVLFHYYQIATNVEGLHFDIQRATSAIAFGRQKDKFISTLKRVFDLLFHDSYNAVLFEKAKEMAKKAFAARYKDGAFRAKYKGFEISELNKHFSLEQLTYDIENITFEMFIASVRTLLVSDNICVYILGDTKDLDFSTISFEGYDKRFDHMVRLGGIGYDPYLREDVHIVSIARKNYNFMIEAFDFLNPKVTNFTKQLIVELSAEMIPASEIDSWVDSFDASILFFDEQLRSYKEDLISYSEPIYNEAHQNLKIKYATLLENSPEIFAVKAANLMTVGIYIDQYLSFLDTCSYETFREVCAKADYKITEAQVVLRKEH